jgi:ubiquinone/menaquinone biosynthesis C-methylase UbiE
MHWRIILRLSLIGIFSTLSFAQNKSVNPGINASYLKEDLVVKEWIERLEAEGREVFHNRDAIVARLELKLGMTIADIGSGTGAHLPLMAKAVSKNGKVYAVDIVPQFLDHIDRQIEQNGWSTVETVLCTERSVELPANSVDLAFICNVYHHFEYPYDSVASIHKALRSGGRIVLIDFKRIPGESSDWILNHMRAGQEVFEEEIIKSGFKKSSEVNDLLKENYMVIFEKVD